MTTHAVARVHVVLSTSSRLAGPAKLFSPRVPRVARQLALAHEIERRIRAGEFNDLAHAARVFGLTRARVTQIVNLTLLTPAIQAAILTMPPATVGRDRIAERMMRGIVAEAEWGRQARMWHELIGENPIRRRAVYAVSR